MKMIPNAIMMKNVTNLFSDLLINDRISFPKLFSNHFVSIKKSTK